MPRLLLSSLIVIVLLACGGEGGAPTPGPDGMVAIAGEGQFGPAGAPLTDSLAVLVTGDEGAPLAGATVQWAASTGGGSVSPGTVVTGADGIARTRRTLGSNAGPLTTKATIVGLPAVTFLASGEIGGVMTIAIAATAPFTDTVLGTIGVGENRIAVKLTDHSGVAVAGATVQWSAGGGGSVSAPTSVTDAQGKATIDYTFGATAGSGFTAKGTVTGLVGSPVNFTLSATAGAPTSLTAVSADPVTAAFGGTANHTVSVRDAHGNGVSGVQVQWAASQGGGSIAPAATTTAAGGNTQSTRTLGPSAGTQQTTATANTLPGTPVVTFTLFGAHLVAVRNNFFSPTTINIAPGESIVWSFLGGAVPHNVTFAPTPGAPANISDQTSGQVEREFTIVGTYNYECTIHAGMTGKVVVSP